MGNEHSGGSQCSKESLSSPTTSTGMPVSFSFMAKKRNSTKSAGNATSLAPNYSNHAGSAGNIVVVSEPSVADPNTDPDLQRIKEIPHFLPLLRSVLPGYRDLPDVHQKIDPRPICRFMTRLREHFRQCAQTVTSEQGRIFAHIVEIDQLIGSLLKKTMASSKKMDALGSELKKVDVIAQQLETTEVLFQELYRSADALNKLLPDEERLPPLGIVFRPIMAEGKSSRERWRKQANEQVDVLFRHGNATNGIIVAVEAGRVSECRVVDSGED